MQAAGSYTVLLNLAAARLAYRRAELATPGCIAHLNQTKITPGHPSLRGAADSSSIQPFRPVLRSRGGRVVQRRILVALALVGLVLLVLVSRAGAARPPTRSAPAR